MSLSGRLYLEIGILLAQDCLQGAAPRIPFEDLGGDSTRRSQAIVTSYQFHCCGDITEWQAYMRPGGGRHNRGVYTIHFQVWRPSPTVTGCYSLVEENRFPGVTLTDRRVSETPEPTNRISVRPGDVLGYFVSSSRAGPGQQQGIQMDPTFTGDEVVYLDLNGATELPFGPSSCPVSVGPGGMLVSTVNAAPVISIGVSKS